MKIKKVSQGLFTPSQSASAIVYQSWVDGNYQSKVQSVASPARSTHAPVRLPSGRRIAFI